jgi:hypothetical protein
MWCYLLQCVFGTLVLRVIFFTFRAWAVQRGDFPDSVKEDGRGEPEPGKGWPFRRAFWECFNGFSQSKAHADLWLNALIGFAELAAYPVFMKLGYMTAIAGWLAVKTAGSWGGWKVSRTSFNRFLLNNILTLAIAYFWLTRFAQGN